MAEQDGTSAAVATPPVVSPAVPPPSTPPEAVSPEPVSAPAPSSSQEQTQKRNLFESVKEGLITNLTAL